MRLLRRGLRPGQGQGLLPGPGQLGRPAPPRGLRLPALPGQESVPPEGADADGQEFAGDLRAGGSLGPRGPPGLTTKLNNRPFVGQLERILVEPCQTYGLRNSRP